MIGKEGANFRWVVLDNFDPTNNAGRLSIIGPAVDPTKASISEATSGDRTIIAAPGSGNRIRILGLWLQNTAGTSITLILKDSATAINGAGWILSTLAFAPIVASPLAPLDLGNNAAFVINLSASTQVSGLVLYTIELV